MALSRSQIATYARTAGFSGTNVDIAVAVALAESGGDPRSYNGVGGDRSYGLWQINMIGDLGPDRRERFGLKSNDDLFDPATNARVAYGIWKSQGWKPWTTYTRGTYKEFMDGDNGSATGGTGGGNGGGSGGGGLDPTLGVASSINSFGRTVLNGMASVGAVAVAIVLLVLGFIILLRSQVATVLPAGKIAKVAKVAKGLS